MYPSPFSITPTSPPSHTPGTLLSIGTEVVSGTVGGSADEGGVSGIVSFFTGGLVLPGVPGVITGTGGVEGGDQGIPTAVNK